jgi:hypothetical protein
LIPHRGGFRKLARVLTDVDPRPNFPISARQSSKIESETSTAAVREEMSRCLTVC